VDTIRKAAVVLGLAAAGGAAHYRGIPSDLTMDTLLPQRIAA